MKVELKRSFVKDLERVRDKGLRERVRETIEQVEGAQTFREIKNIKKLRGGDRYYRIRIGDYRLGLVLEGDVASFCFEAFQVQFGITAKLAGGLCASR